MQAYTKSETSEEFSKSRTIFRQIVGWLEEEGSLYLSHDEVERQLQDRGRELLRQLYQDHLDLRSEREPRLKLEEANDGSSLPAASIPTVEELYLQKLVCRLDVSFLHCPSVCALS